MPGMYHSKMNMPGMDHGAMSTGGQDHGAMKMKSTSAPKPAESMPGMKHDQATTAPSAPAHDMGAMVTGGGEMDHRAMPMHGGSAPADARDTNVYPTGTGLKSSTRAPQNPT